MVFDILGSIGSEKSGILKDMEESADRLGGLALVVLDAREDVSGVWGGLFAEDAFSRDLCVDKLPEDLPSPIGCLLNAAPYKRFAWIGPSACAADLTHFVWVCAHELRHLYQYETWPHLKRLNEFLFMFSDRCLGRRMDSMEMPIEVDAERAAMDMVINLLGQPTLDAYWEKQCKLSDSRRAYLIVLKDRLQSSCGDVVADTRTLILSRDRAALRCLRREQSRCRHLNVDADWLLQQ